MWHIILRGRFCGGFPTDANDFSGYVPGSLHNHTQDREVLSSTMAQTTLRKSCALLTSFERTARSYKALRMTFLALTVVGLPSCISSKYPQDALRCLASLTEPDGLLICPEHRCVLRIACDDNMSVSRHCCTTEHMARSLIKRSLINKIHDQYNRHFLGVRDAARYIL